MPQGKTYKSFFASFSEVKRRPFLGLFPNLRANADSREQWPRQFGNKGQGLCPLTPPKAVVRSTPRVTARAFFSSVLPPSPSGDAPDGAGFLQGHGPGGAVFDHRFAGHFVGVFGIEHDVGAIAGDVYAVGFANRDDGISNDICFGGGGVGIPPIGAGIGALPDVGREIIDDDGIGGAGTGGGFHVALVEAGIELLDRGHDIGFVIGEGWNDCWCDGEGGGEKEILEAHFFVSPLVVFCDGA